MLACQLVECLRLSLLIVADTLSPAERVAYVLHAMFALPLRTKLRALGAPRQKHKKSRPARSGLNQLLGGTRMNPCPLYTVAFLSIPEAQAQWIQNFRRKYDPQFTVVEPHFTMVFGIRDVEESVYLEHIASVAKSSKPIRFRCTYAMLGADDIEDTAYVFLVPNEGNAEVSLLHDRLYQGVLRPYLRLEFPYIPHVTIASTQEFRLAKQLCDELNGTGVHVEGCLPSLSAGALKDGKLQPLRTFQLGA